MVQASTLDQSNQNIWSRFSLLTNLVPGQPVVQPLNSNDAAVPEDDILNFFKVREKHFHVIQNISSCVVLFNWFLYLYIFFQCYKCYDLIPTSAKLVILDTELILKQVSSSQRNQIFRITNENVYLVDFDKISGIFRDGGHRGPSLSTLGFSKAKICRHAHHHRFHKVFISRLFSYLLFIGSVQDYGWKPPNVGSLWSSFSRVLPKKLH